jgi:hypothetical protein
MAVVDNVVVAVVALVGSAFSVGSSKLRSGML